VSVAAAISAPTTALFSERAPAANPFHHVAHADEDDDWVRRPTKPRATVQQRRVVLPAGKAAAAAAAAAAQGGKQKQKQKQKAPKAGANRVHTIPTGKAAAAAAAAAAKKKGRARKKVAAASSSSSSSSSSSDDDGGSGGAAKRRKTGNRYVHKSPQKL
jgi:hypothetical protein